MSSEAEDAFELAYPVRTSKRTQASVAYGGNASRWGLMTSSAVPLAARGFA